ncbi:MarR family transcriptional regulator [Salipiger sp. IMCC34102]|uniref:MarR family winged helix-turn-helix transcriptional regulator n=1 Tax=Salipiger sp. IMCC34102 TaxID=2510647 RepID=UPI00101C78BC|nr:MarR family transcriptional regulator [Salipiger sp. IMCC34102]RYH04260.1 MarR family transcriptional regulator [Salipiger sp. IMCC34102]
MTDRSRNVPTLERLVGYNLKRAYMVVQGDYRAALGDGALAPRVFSALTLVVEFPQISQSDLARRLGIERSGLVAIVGELEERGLLERADVPGDKRVQALVATPEGTRACNDAMARVQAHEDRLLGMLTEAERATLIALLAKIRQAEDVQAG